MGTILASAIVEKASVVLRDTEGRRWTASELLGWLNDGQREVGLYRPDSITIRRNLTLVEGSEQALPSGCIRVVDITHNMGAGTVPGAPITLVDREVLDLIDAAWRANGASETVVHWVYDARVPKTYEIWPPALTPGRSVRAAVQVDPTPCTIDGVDEQGVSSPIFLDDIYSTALVEYVLHRAYDKNAETRDVGKANSFYGRFLQRLGMKADADLRNDPNKNAPPAQQSRQPGGVSARARPNG